jgi:hypothetical protein
MDRLDHVKLGFRLQDRIYHHNPFRLAALRENDTTVFTPWRRALDELNGDWVDLMLHPPSGLIHVYLLVRYQTARQMRERSWRTKVWRKPLGTPA